MKRKEFWDMLDQLICKIFGHRTETMNVLTLAWDAKDRETLTLIVCKRCSRLIDSKFKRGV